MQRLYSPIKRATALASSFTLVLAIGVADASAATLYGSKIDWQSGGGYDGDGTKTPNRGDPDNALDQEDSTGRQVNFLSLRGRTAVFNFGEPFKGPAKIFEATFNCSEDGAVCSGHEERVEVWAGSSYVLDSFNINGFTPQGEIGNAEAQGGGSININGTYEYLALVDNSNRGTDGFDVDAVQVSSVEEPPASIPLPGTLGLLGFGMMALGFVARRRHA